MSDPERLLNGTNGQDELERSLLGSLRVVTVPAQARALVWGALSVTVAEATAMAGSAPLWQGALKLIASQKALFAVPVVVAALGAGIAVRQHRPQLPPPAVSQPVRVATVAPVAPAPAAPADAPANVEPAEQLAPRPASLAERLRQESSLLTRARAELRSGNPRAAQATLGRMQHAFGGGALGQERTVLNIEALAAEGNLTAAARGARAFIAAHPESPHVASLQRFVN